MMRTLVLTKTLPWPPNSGEKQRTLGLVRALRRLGPVTVAGFAGPHEDISLASEDQVSVRAVAHRPPTPATLARRTAQHRSITAAKWWDEELRAIVEDEIREGVDLILVMHVQMAVHLPSSVPKGVTTVLDMHNVESLLTRRLGRTMRSWKRLPVMAEGWFLTRLEKRLVPRFQVVTVVSDADKAALSAIVAHPDVLVVPNAVDVTEAPLPAATEPVASYVGLMSWAPNADAAVQFTSQVWPAVRNQVAGATLLLVGRDPTPDVVALASADVEVTGTVPEVLPYYARSRVALAPLLAGGGSRLKILEALALGRPVVATRVGAEGLEDLIGRGVVVADEPSTMAAEIAGLLRDPERATSLGAVGAEAVRTDHSWEAATRPLLDRLGELNAGR